MENKLAEINATVVPKTKETLEVLANASGLSVGEVIDRMLLAVSPSDVNDAYLLILDQVLIATQRLEHDQFNEVILMVLKALEDAFAKDEPEEIVSTLKNVVNKLSVRKFLKNNPSILENQKMVFHKVKEVTPLEDYILKIKFIEGCTKKYDVKPLFDELPYFADLKDNDLFSKVYVSGGGYGIIWNDVLDLDCNELWNNGTIIE